MKTPNELSKTEFNVVVLKSSGLRNKEIADVMFISPSTVQCHIYNIYKKLDVHNGIEMINKFNQDYQ